MVLTAFVDSEPDLLLRMLEKWPLHLYDAPSLEVLLRNRVKSLSDAIFSVEGKLSKWKSVEDEHRTGRVVKNSAPSSDPREKRRLARKYVRLLNRLLVRQRQHVRLLQRSLASLYVLFSSLPSRPAPLFSLFFSRFVYLVCISYVEFLDLLLQS